MESIFKNEADAKKACEKYKLELVGKNGVPKENTDGGIIPILNLKVRPEFKKNDFVAIGIANYIIMVSTKIDGSAREIHLKDFLNKYVIQ